MSTTVSTDPIARLAERQNWLTPESEKELQAGVTAAVMKLGGPTLRRALHGDWLHEPLHAILTDVPIGSWTATVAFDVTASITKSEALDAAADATLILGLLGASAAAVTGMNDWAEIKSPAARRIGLVQATLNIAATGLFLSSAVARFRKARTAGRALAGVGYALVSLSAHLGGSLVYEHGIGVAKTPETSAVTEDIQA